MAISTSIFFSISREADASSGYAVKNIDVDIVFIAN